MATSRKLWSFLYPSIFSFNRMSYTWNHTVGPCMKSFLPSMWQCEISPNGVYLQLDSLGCYVAYDPCADLMVSFTYTPVDKRLGKIGKFLLYAFVCGFLCAYKFCLSLGHVAVELLMNIFSCILLWRRKFQPFYLKFFSFLMNFDRSL